MAQPKNLRYGPPIFPLIQGYTPRRSKFLDGSVQAYFAPGQDPDIIGTKYYNPTDWPAAGMPLVPPQVVWLELRIDLTDTATGNAMLANSGCKFGQIAGKLDQLYGVGAWYVHYDPPYPPWHTGAWTSDVTLQDEMQTNLAMAEKGRLLTAMQAAKAQVEALRPGKTWVRIVNWLDNFPAGAKGNATLDVGNLFDGTPVPVPTQSWDTKTVEYRMVGAPPTQVNSWRSCTATFLPAPTVSPGLYYGVDFLDVYCGNVVMTSPSGQPAFYYPGNPAGDSVPANSFLQGATFKNLYTTFKAAAPAFHRLAVRHFHPDFKWKAWTMAKAGQWMQHFWDFVVTDLPNQIGSWTHSEQYTAFPLAGKAGFPSTDVANNRCSGQVAYAASVYDQVAGQASSDKLDVKHPGGTSTVTAASLVALIAAHYGFDPETGKELPVTKTPLP